MKVPKLVKIILAIIPIVLIALVPLIMKISNNPISHLYNVGDCVESNHTPTTYKISSIDLDKEEYSVEVVKYNGLKINGFNSRPAVSIELMDSKENFTKKTCP